MEDHEKKAAAGRILKAISGMQSEAGGWIPFSKLGAELTKYGVDYKKHGYSKLRPFLNDFQDILEFHDVNAEGKTPVCFVRPRPSVRASGAARGFTPAPASAPRFAHASESAPALVRTPGLSHESAPGPDPGSAFAPHTAASGAAGQRIPNKDSWLYNWAFIAVPHHLKALADLALEERWHYGDTQAGEKEDYSILWNYLAYTFKRLVFEGKIRFESDPRRGNEEYAAFNTGLVDKKYEYIYALFKQNTRYPKPYWFLLGFVVAGEDIGKTLVSLFNPLPERADYFENKIENMLYDTTTGDLSCDYTHILAERTFRLPLDFLKDNCPDELLSIDGVSIDEIYHAPMSPAKKQYFLRLGASILNNSRYLNRLKNRLDDAVKLAQKRVEWNYKTAIPMYYPTKNRGALLLPLALTDEDRIDLALVVERQPSGSYQGQTILPLHMAYSNSRLVTRPDSDWLKTDLISSSTDDNDED